MEKPATCEWQDCQKKPKVYRVLDEEKYWFCGNDHAEEFCGWIIQSGNY